MTEEKTATESADTATPPVQETPAAPEMEVAEYNPVPVTIKSMLDAGTHFGHQTRRWNPKMMPYIFGERNGVHIINLDITLKYWERAKKYVTDIASQGGQVLFVGTKQQAREIIREHAERCSSFYVTSRWLGGTLSNFETIKKSIDRMTKLEELLGQAENEDSEVRLNKKEKLSISRELEKLNINLGGIRSMKKHPHIVFLTDIKKESIALAEARKLHIPVVALVDTNTDPRDVDFPIPANDDAIKTIRLFTAGIADAVIEGNQQYIARRPKEEANKEAEEKVKAEVETANGNGKAAKTTNEVAEIATA